MKIYLGTDHAGYEYKEAIKAALLEDGHDVEDMGAHTYEELDDYPDFVYPAAKAVGEDPEHRYGIVFGGSGTGEGVVANKVKGVRACIGFSEWAVVKGREHNNANVLSLGGRTISKEEAVAFARLFLKTPFSNDERHVRRIEKVKAIEAQVFKD